MRALAFSVLLLSACTTVEDTCPAEDLDCWMEHLEADLDGDPLTPSDTFTLLPNGGGIVPVEVGASRARVWVVGANGRIGALANDTWTLQTSGTIATLRAVWASSENDVWAGGDGELLHFDGVTWSRVSTALLRIDAISGSGSNDVWFSAGAQGVVHFDGAGFSTVNLSVGVFTPSTLTVIAPGEVWIGAIDGALVHGDGTSFTRVTSRTTNAIRGIAALSPQDVYFVSDQLFRGDATRGFDAVPTAMPVTGLSAVHAANGLVFAVNGPFVVSGPRPEFAVTPNSAQANGVWFDGQVAFVAGQNGSVSRLTNSATEAAIDVVENNTAWLAISGARPPPEFDPRVTLSFDAGLTAGDGGLPIQPGARTAIPFTFTDFCGARPGVCVSLCLRSSRCFAGPSLCRQPLPDQRIQGFATLYVKLNARPIGEEPKLDTVVGPISWAKDGGVDSFVIARRLQTTILGPPGGTGGGGGSTGGGGGATGGGSGGGGNTCDHCAEGQMCTACGPGRTCGESCCAPNETCMGPNNCRVSATSGHGRTTIAACGATPRYTVSCGNGGCCPTCMICRTDGLCDLP